MENFAALAAEWTSGGTRLLVTCRDSQPRLDSGSLTCRPFALGELNVTEGLMLLIGFLDRLGFDRTAREEHGWTVDALEPIVVKTCGHPLALELLAPHVVRLGAEAVARELPDVLAGAEQQHDEARNRSIQQSLDFSIRHLSAEARAALPAVALLSGGCLENMGAMIVGLEEEPWKKVRSELERTGLVRVEGSFLRPHPVLDSRLSHRERSADAVVAGPATVVAGSPDPATDPTEGLPTLAAGSSDAGDLRSADVGGSETSPQLGSETSPQLGTGPQLERKATIDRFLDVVAAFCGEFDKLVRTPQARMALGAMAGSEVVVRRAIDLAAATRRVEQVVRMADGLRLFLERSGRGGEGAALMTGLQESLIAPRSKRSDRGAINDYDAQLAIQTAWARAREDAAGAAAELNRLLDELADVTSWDTRFERALTLMTLGRIRYNFEHHPAEAIAPLEQAVALFEELEAVEDNREATASESETPAETHSLARRAAIDSTNRAATLGDFANALVDLGRFDEALDAAERGWALDRDRNDQSAAARSLGQIAHILRRQGRYDQAETRYHEALNAAQDTGDDELAGILWQGLGIMNLDRQRPDEAAPALRQALDAFARAGDTHGQMRVLNSLGEVERHRGNAEAALAWYERSLELAQQLGDVKGQSEARSNRAILLSTEAEAATDLAARQRLLNQAISEERESLALKEQMGHPANIAISHNNLANRLRLAGQLDEAEQHARTALAIRQQLSDPKTWQTLLLLEKIAEARGDTSAAAEYRAAKEAAYAEAQERAGGGGLPRETIVGLLQLALTARHHKLSLTDALRSAGADDNVLAAIQQNAAWLATHLEALAANRARPATEVPAAHQPLIDEVWQAASS